MPAAQLIGYRPLVLGFNSLPILKDHAKIHFTRDVPLELGSIVRKYGLESEYGITRIHRHFDLKQDEILVQSLSPDGSHSILSPWTLQDGQAMPADMSLLETQNMKVLDFIVPRTWKLTDGQNGVMVPCEYANVNDPANDQGTTTFEFEPSFVQEFYNFLLNLGWEGEVGVTKLRKERNMHGLETSNRATRCSTTIHVANQEEAIRRGAVQVTWDFSTTEFAGSCTIKCSAENCLEWNG